jgi:hypothetical protein
LLSRRLCRRSHSLRRCRNRRSSRWPMRRVTVTHHHAWMIGLSMGVRVTVSGSWHGHASWGWYSSAHRWRWSTMHHHHVVRRRRNMSRVPPGVIWNVRHSSVTVVRIARSRPPSGGHFCFLFRRRGCSPFQRVALPPSSKNINYPEIFAPIGGKETSDFQTKKVPLLFALMLTQYQYSTSKRKWNQAIDLQIRNRC